MSLFENRFVKGVAETVGTGHDQASRMVDNLAEEISKLLSKDSKEFFEKLDLGKMSPAEVEEVKKRWVEFKLDVSLGKASVNPESITETK